MKAMQLWAELFTVLHPTTGEIMADRETLADRLGIEPRTVSEIMGELTTINAIRKAKDGRKVRYGMNPNIATHLPDPAIRAGPRCCRPPARADGRRASLTPKGQAFCATKTQLATPLFLPCFSSILIRRAYPKGWRRIRSSRQSGFSCLRSSTWWSGVPPLGPIGNVLLSASQG